MSPLVLVVAAPAFGCLGLFLVITGWRQPHPSVAATMRLVHRPGDGVDTRTVEQDSVEVVGTRLAETLGVDVAQRWRRMLRLVGRTPERHLGILAIGACAGALAPSSAVVAAQVVGGLPGDAPRALPAGLALIGALVVPLALHRAVADRADAIAQDLRHQLSSYLDMVAMLLAGNTGHEAALEQAARAGDGLLFVELRRKMRDVATTGDSMVAALALVADDLDLPELANVAAATGLAAAEGAPVARALTAKCATLRSTLATDEEAAARIRTDKVTPPLVGMALIFMALIVYPALFSG